MECSRDVLSFPLHIYNLLMMSISFRFWIPEKMELRQVITVDFVEGYAAKGHGVITCMASGNGVIVLGTSTGWLIRHDFGVGDSYAYGNIISASSEYHDPIKDKEMRIKCQEFMH